MLCMCRVAELTLIDTETNWSVPSVKPCSVVHHSDFSESTYKESALIKTCGTSINTSRNFLQIWQLQSYMIPVTMLDWISVH